MKKQYARNMRLLYKWCDGMKEIRVYVGRYLEFIAYRSDGRYVIQVCKGGYAGYWLTAEPETDEGVIAACKEFYNEHNFDKAA